MPGLTIHDGVSQVIVDGAIVGLDRSVLTIDGRCYRSVVWERTCGGLDPEAECCEA